MAEDRRIARLRRAWRRLPGSGRAHCCSGNPPGDPDTNRTCVGRAAAACLAARPQGRVGGACRCCPGVSWVTARRSAVERTSPHGTGAWIRTTITRARTSWPTVSRHPCMVRPVGLAPTIPAWRADALLLRHDLRLVHPAGIEPAPPAFQTGARTSYATGGKLNGIGPGLGSRAHWRRRYDVPTAVAAPASPPQAICGYRTQSRTGNLRLRRAALSLLSYAAWLREQDSNPHRRRVTGARPTSWAIPH